MNINVKQGYKQTDVGVVPEDWETTPLGELCSCFSGGTPSTSIPSYYGGDIPWITSSDLNKERITAVDGRITSKGLSNSAAKVVNQDSLLLALYGATAGVCATTAIRAAINQAVLAIIPKQMGTEFLFQFLRHKKDFYIATYTQGGQPNFSGAIVKTFVIPCPPLPEQEAIAQALSDADALIDSLEQLIAKKRQVKEGAMQQLLTGRRRLPGFSGAWEVKRLGDVADVKTGPFGSALHESDYVLDGTPIITVEHLGELGVEHSNLPLVSEADRHRLLAYSLEDGDIVFSRVGSVDRNALIRSSEAGWLFSGRLLRVRSNKGKAFAPFLSFQFHSEPFKASVRTVAVGQTMASLNTKILKGLLVTLPTVAEQAAIAEVLSDMDAEIAGLTDKREKARKVKQGMMQELLTGRIRLV